MSQSECGKHLRAFFEHLRAFSMPKKRKPRHRRAIENNRPADMRQHVDDPPDHADICKCIIIPRPNANRGTRELNYRFWPRQGVASSRRRNQEERQSHLPRDELSVMVSRQKGPTPLLGQKVSIHRLTHPCPVGLREWPIQTMLLYHTPGLP